MERTPSLTIEGNPLLIRKSFKENHYYRNNPLTIEGHALRINNNNNNNDNNSNNSWKSPTTEGSPLLMSK